MILVISFIVLIILAVLLRAAEIVVTDLIRRKD